VTEPDIRSRLVAPGIVAFRFFDFPLTQHRNTWAAHNAAACADDQGKFWEMHDHLYAHQDEWNGEVTNDPMKVFRRYAKEIGMDVASWENCVTTQAHAGRIKGNQEEGTRRRITGTPTFIVGDKMVGGVSYDEFKRMVDAALAADSAARKGAAR
jgi:protein-disulfide isomerase